MTSESNLVPLQEITQPVLSPRQATDLTEATRLYLRRSQVPITTETFKRGTGVLGDAIFRALSAHQQRAIRPSDKLKPLINEGLELRNQLRQQAAGIIQLTNEHPTVDDKYIGPYAFPVSQFRRLVQVSDAEFTVTPNLTLLEQVVQSAKAREGYLSLAVQQTINSLPQELTDVDMTQFAVPEQAKIIRNAAVANTFRGSPSPVLNIEDLQDFATRIEVLHNFEEEAVTIFLESLSINPEARPFVAALFHQAVYPLLKTNSYLRSGDDRHTYSQHQRYSGTFLLLHPIFSEASISLDPATDSPSEATLWDNGIETSEYILPSILMIDRALRQQRVKGEPSSIARLELAEKIVTSHLRSLSRKEQRVPSAEKRLTISKQNLASVSMPDFVLPTNIEVEDAEVSSAKAEHASNARRLRNASRTISEYESDQLAAIQYKEWLKATYGNDLPDTVPMPVLIEWKRQQSTENTLSTTLTRTANELSSFLNFLDTDILTAVLPTIFTPASTKPVPSELTDRLERTKLLTQEFNAHPELIPFTPAQWVILQEELGQRVSRYHNAPAAHILFHRYHTFIIQFFTASKRHPDRKAELWNQFVAFGLDFRSKLLEVAIPKSMKIQATQVELEEHQQSKTLSEEPITNIGGTREISRLTAMRYIKNAELTKLPHLPSDNPDLAFGVLMNIVRTLDGTPKKLIPSRIEGITGFQEHILGLIEAYQMQIKYAVDIRKRSKAEQNLHLLQQLQLISSHPLAPFPQEGFVFRKDFIEIWRKRALIVIATSSLDQLKREVDQNLTQYKQLKKEAYIKKLMASIANQENDLQALKNNELPSEQLEQLRLANLLKMKS